MRWCDRDEVAALLTGIAALRLGDERAAAIGEELRERAAAELDLARAGDGAAVQLPLDVSLRPSGGNPPPEDG
jgi:hypothetical protein